MSLLNMDIQTIIALLFIGNLTAVIIFAAYESEPALKRPYRQFILGKILQTMAWLLLGLRGNIPDLLSVYVGNTFLFLGFALEALAMITVHRSDRRWELTYAILAAMSIAAFWGVADTPNVRVGVASLITIILFGTTSAAMMLTSAESRLRKGLGILYGLFCLILVFRSWLGFFASGEVTLTSTHPVQTLAFFQLYLFMLVGGTGYLLMQKERDDRLLKESEEKYRTLVEKANEAIAIVQDLHVVFANSRMSELLGVSTPSLIGLPFLQFVSPEDREMVSANYEARIYGKEVPDTYDFRIIGVDRGETWVYISATEVQWNGANAILCLLTDINDRKRMEAEREKIISELQQALSQVKTLSGLLPICASCKKIRDDKGYWNHVETYLEAHSEAEFSHGICPECAKKLYPGIHVDLK